jgi:heat shock protein HslJ
VTLTEAGRSLSGCGGQPGDLITGRWTVEALDGAALSETAEVDITFDPATGRVFGTSGCNRYSGGFTLTGEGLGFGAAAGTMMACPEDQMAVEQAFLSGLTTISRFDIAADGALELYAADRVVIRARR